MNGKERTQALFNNEPADRAGFWLGNPTPESKELYKEYFKLDSQDLLRSDVDLAHCFDSDLFWCAPELDPDSYKDPEGRPMWDTLGGKKRTSLGQPGVFAEVTEIKEIEAFPWPDPDLIDFSSTVETADYAASKGMAVVGGMWMPFFHVLCDFFGMENYFVKMFTHPELVEEITKRVVDFYLEANKRCILAMRDRLDAVFFGNDLGSQQTLLVGPDQLEQFVFPGMERIVRQARSLGKKVMLHSCGAVSKIIPRFLEIGIDALHPLQARAVGMDAESLARNYTGRLLFVGGVDTQELLPFGTEKEIKAEVQRLKEIFGERFVVSPSHEALLPNVSPEKVIAMRDAALDN